MLACGLSCVVFCVIVCLRLFVCFVYWFWLQFLGMVGLFAAFDFRFNSVAMLNGILICGCVLTVLMLVILLF